MSIHVFPKQTYMYYIWESNYDSVILSSWRLNWFGIKNWKLKLPIKRECIITILSFYMFSVGGGGEIGVGVMYFPYKFALIYECFTLLLVTYLKSIQHTDKNTHIFKRCCHFSATSSGWQLKQLRQSSWVIPILSKNLCKIGKECIFILEINNLIEIILN